MMRSFLKKHWDKVIIAIVTLILFFVIFLPFILYNSLDKFDTPGLLSLSWFIREYTFPDFQGWNPYFAAGFPQGILYPPLFHYIVAAIGKIISLELSYKLVVTAAGLLIPLSCYFFNKKIYKKKGFAMLSTLIMLMVLIAFPGHLGFNFDGLIDYGLGPSFASIPLFFWFLGTLFSKKFNVRNASIIFSILVLTHLLTAAVAGIISATWFVSRVHSSKKAVIKFISFVFISFLLTAFWTIPFIAFKQYSASGFAQPVSGMFPAFIMFGVFTIAIALILTKSLKNKKIWALLLPSFLIAIVGSADSIFNRGGARFSIPLIHPFRLQMYGIILVTACATFAIIKIHPLLIKLATKLKLIKFFKPNPHLMINLSAICCLLFAFSYQRINPKGVEEVILKQPLDWDGRAVRVYKVTEVLDQSRAVIDKSIMQNPSKFAADGLLKESSYLAPYFQSLEKNLNPENYDWDKLDDYYVENRKIPEKKVAFLADLLWVTNVFSIDKDIPNLKNCEEISEFRTQTAKEGQLHRDIYECAYSPTKQSTFIESLSKEPEVKEFSGKVIDDWWTSDSTETIIDEELPTDITFGNDSNFIHNFSNNFTKLEITTDQDKKIPTLIKMNYFPKWKAYDKEGRQVDIVRAFPNFMLVPLEGEVTLKYERTWCEWGSLGISAVSWIALVAFIVYKKITRWGSKF